MFLILMIWLDYHPISHQIHVPICWDVTLVWVKKCLQVYRKKKLVGEFVIRICHSFSMKDLVPRYANLFLENQIEKFCAGELQTMGESDVCKNVGKKISKSAFWKCKSTKWISFFFFKISFFIRGILKILARCVGHLRVLDIGDDIWSRPARAQNQLCFLIFYIYA